jgi:hypothetical protein
MLFPFALSSSLRYRAAEVPVIPVPTITISASDGNSSVVLWPSKNLFGSLCQNEFEDVGVGSVARACFMVCDSDIGAVMRTRSVCGDPTRLYSCQPYLLREGTNAV